MKKETFLLLTSEEEIKQQMAEIAHELTALEEKEIKLRSPLRKMPVS